MNIDRRIYVALAVGSPMLPHYRERQIGHGCHPETGELIHETIQQEHWDGQAWTPIGRPHTILYQDGEVVKRYDEPRSIDEIDAQRSRRS